MKFIPLFILFSFIFLNGQAQDSTYNEYLNNGKSKPARTNDYNWRNRFYFGAGGSFLLIETPYYFRQVIPLVSLVPRFNVMEFENLTSLSLLSNAGFVLQFSNYGTASILHLPLMLEYNIGHDATLESDFPVGFSLGGGVEYFGSRFGTNRFRQWAAIGSAGLRFDFGQRSYYLRASQSFMSSQKFPTTLISLGSSF